MASHTIMSKISKALGDKLALSLIVVSAVLLLFTAIVPRPGSDSAVAARRLERKLEKRLSLLDYYA